MKESEKQTNTIQSWQLKMNLKLIYIYYKTIVKQLMTHHSLSVSEVSPLTTASITDGDLLHLEQHPVLMSKGPGVHRHITVGR